jgi:hypothetical protein
MICLRWNEAAAAVSEAAAVNEAAGDSCSCLPGDSCCCVPCARAFGMRPPGWQQETDAAMCLLIKAAGGDSWERGSGRQLLLHTYV